MLGFVFIYATFFVYCCLLLYITVEGWRSCIHYDIHTWPAVIILPSGHGQSTCDHIAGHVI